MKVFDIEFISYRHPFVCFEVSVSEGAYIRSLAQIFLKKISCIGTLSYLERLSEGKFFYENEKELNPLEFLNLERNIYKGDISYLENGKKILLEYLEKKEDKIYILLLEEFFSIIEVKNKEVKYLLNKVKYN